MLGNGDETRSKPGPEFDASHPSLGLYYGGPPIYVCRQAVVLTEVAHQIFRKITHVVLSHGRCRLRVSNEVHKQDGQEEPAASDYLGHLRTFGGSGRTKQVNTFVSSCLRLFAAPVRVWRFRDKINVKIFVLLFQLVQCAPTLALTKRQSNV